MNMDIDNVLYTYLFVCTIIIIFNIFYIYSSNQQKKKYYEYSKWWQKSIGRQLEFLKEGKHVEISHNKSLEIQLASTKQLISYANALDKLREQGENLQGYLREIYIPIRTLAYKYNRKEVSDRAFFAFFISKNPPCDGLEYNQLMKMLISYIDNSNVYCRENVLKALYAFENFQAIENALQIMNDRKLFHHPKLISDGLMSFSGDKEELAEHLWKYLEDWEDNLVIAVIKFIALTSGAFKERFFKMLESGDMGIDLKIEILRYYRNYIYEPVLPLLINYLKDENNIDENVRIVAAYVLDKYPSEDTILALKDALKSPSWYLRYNAASSLKNLKVDINKLQDVLSGEDKYAQEIITYMMSL